MKGLGCVKDTVFGIEFDLANGPMPDAGQMIEPVGELPFLSGIETEFELSLDHTTSVFG